ncbi:MAG: deoxynucleoside kinase [Verrucomicrobiota bacterium]|nr:deoxynucleoside kinase [Verrucomicrobiota bacterium]
MSLHVSVIGIDGSGKSTLAASLPMLLAAEYNIMAGGAGETYVVNGPKEDHLCDEFTPDGLPLTARISTRLKKLAKRFTNHRRIYPFFKMPQMMAQDSAARRMERKWALDCVVSDGNTILSTMGRAANYLYPASTGEKSIPPSPEDLAAVLEYVLEGKELREEQKNRLPSLRAGRYLRLISNALGLKSVWLPDVVVLLKLNPEVALERIHSRGQQVDRHENAQDLAQTHKRYHTALETVRHIRGDDSVITIDVSDKNPGETLRAAVAALRSHILKQKAQRDKEQPLGTTKTKLTEGGIWSKVLNPRYLLGYFFPYFFRGAWREPMFPFSRAGQRFLKEGYSAGVMKEIYDHDPQTSSLSGRIFQNYPLHRAVNDRLQLLAKNIKPELESRLRSKGRVALFTAPSGFAYDVFGPMENIARRNPELMDKVDLLAVDLDPHGVLAPGLEARAKKLGINFTFRQGDLTEAKFRNQCAAEGPFDLALFVGLSSWFPKPSTLSHLRWLSQNLDPDGRLVTDCFTPSGYSLSGRYVGYQAHYYSPQRYRMLLEAAGFDGFGAQVEAGRDSINHVVLAKAHREERIKRSVQANGKSRPKNARPVASSPKHRQLVPA